LRLDSNLLLVVDIYYTVFRRVNKQLPLLNYARHDISNFSPALHRARSLELGVPGSYRVDGSYVNIEKFIPDIEIITSKQRPRKITLRGNDGNDYVFLLKGHEDLRQDERVMQLFGLVNALLIRDHQTRKHDLKIQRYAISPLSHDCGVVGWVPHTDTFHSLIRDYRQSKSIPLNLENRETQKIAPDNELLTVMQKVEVFIETLKRTTGKGNDLYEILWLKSANSEEWLERRTKFTRSLAVMSMVGYILGLGDRHPSNLMLDKLSGRVFHIDFGDCFEVSMNREKIPERVPFRLTRMLIKAMEVAGIEGSYRSTCERTMSVLRDSKDSLVAMLEAFVYDPLISWRLADVSKDLQSGPQPPAPTDGYDNNIETADVGLSMEVNRRSIVDPISEDPEEDDGEEGGNEFNATSTFDHRVAPINHPLAVGAASRERSLQIYTEMQNIAADHAVDSRIASITAERSAQTLAIDHSLAHSRIERSIRQREVLTLLTGDEGAAREVALNEKALRVIRRVEDKLTGTDFIDCEGQPLPVPDQVQRLIVQATSTENLCQHYIGWCAFW
jgi:phosphatidylinositol kinase/protein kinase (PI-3  family)